MNIESALMVYLVIVVVLFLVLVRLGKVKMSAFIISILIGMCALCFLCPPSEIDPVNNGINSATAFYIVISFATPVIICAYTLYSAWYTNPMEMAMLIKK